MLIALQVGLAKVRHQNAKFSLTIAWVKCLGNKSQMSNT